MTDLSKSRVRRDNGGLLLVHHITSDERFDPAQMAVFSHFGTRRAGRQRAFDWPDKRQISGFLNIENPLELPDPGKRHDLVTWLELIAASPAGAALQAGLRDRIETHEQETGEGLEVLAQELRDAGWDGIRYLNACEDPGSVSWVLLDPRQLRLVSDGPARENRDPWELTEAEFIGPSIVQPVFEIDGRDAEHDMLWEALAEDTNTMPLVARDADGFEVRWMPDWCPEATLGLFAHNGAPCGFYMDAQLWIDEGHRGKGLSRLLIGAAADMLGGQPTQNEKGCGFSEAGYGAHASAWRAICDQARLRGDLEPLEDAPEP